MGKMIFSLIIKYIESHPEVLTEVFDEVVKTALKALKLHNASA